MTNDLKNLANKRHVFSLLNTIAESNLSSIGADLAKAYHPDAQWRGSHPWNELQGVEAIEHQFWRPVLHSFPDLERRDSIFMGGDYEGRSYVGAVGHLVGTFKRDWNGITASDQVVYWRYGEFHQVVEGKIIQSTVLLDVLDFVRQAGFWPIAQSLGQECMWPGPLASDGILLTPQGEIESAASLKLTMDMQESLGAYDDTLGGGREGLLTMPQKNFWHQKMMWYGPSGIGTTRGLEGFVDNHQLPFRTAFPRNPNKQAPGLGKHGGSHYVRIGDGCFSATGGWPSRHMMHLGGGWLGQGATGRAITMRVMDFYRADQGMIRENWVPIDMLNVLLQLDVDVLARVQKFFRKRTTG